MSALQTFLKSIDTRPAACLLILTPFILLYLTLASFWTSPFIPLYNGDSAAFFAMGDGLLHGRLPYRDLFDHKGPFLYLIYAIGEYLFSLKTGLFILQGVNFCVCSLAAYKIARLKLAPLPSWLVTATFLFACAGCMTGGGLTEEWSLPFNLIPFYFVFRKLTRKIPFSPSADAGLFLFLGSAVGLHVMLRITNAAPVCGLIGFLGIYFLSRRSWLLLLSLSGLSFCGAILAILPFVCWFSAHGALADLHFGVLGYNCLYAAQGTATKSTADYLTIATRMLCIPLFAIRAFFCIRNKSVLPEALCALCVAFTCVIALIPGRMYSHYFLISIVCLLWAIIIAAEMMTAKRKGRQSLLYTVAAVFILLPYLPSSVRMFGVGVGNLYHYYLAPDNYHICGVKREFYEEFQVASKINSLLPQDKEAAVLAYSSNPAFLLYMNRRPCFKYFFIQSDIRRIYSEAREEMRDFFSGENTADWIVYQGKGIRGDRSDSPNPDADPVVTFIRNRCEKIGTYGETAPYTLYKRIR